MRLELFICKDDPRKVEKDFGEPVIQIMDAKIYRECSAMYPEFLIPYSEAAIKCNAVYLAIPNRPSWYFIADRILLPGGRMVLVCKKDVLSSWVSELYERTANVIRQENEPHFSTDNPSRFISDPCMVGKVNTNFNHIPFPNSTTMFKIPNEGNEYSYVLTVLGGLRGTPPESTTTGGE